MSTVIAAIDNSAAARPVLVAALALADTLGATVNAVHVTEADGETAPASAASLGVAFSELHGDPVEQIALLGRRDDVVAVAAGTRRRLKDRGGGHLAQAVADRIDKPVLVVPPGIAPAERLHTVLIAMEGTPAKARAIKAVLEVAERADLHIVVLHVDDESSIPSFSDQTAHDADAYAQAFLTRYVRGAPRARLELRVGVPPDEIVATSAAISADIVALGWPQSPDGSRGPVAREVLDRSRTPVLLVPLAATPDPPGSEATNEGVVVGGHRHTTGP